MQPLNKHSVLSINAGMALSALCSSHLLFSILNSVTFCLRCPLWLSLSALGPWPVLFHDYTDFLCCCLHCFYNGNCACGMSNGRSTSVFAVSKNRSWENRLANGHSYTASMHFSSKKNFVIISTTEDNNFYIVGFFVSIHLQTCVGCLVRSQIVKLQVQKWQTLLNLMESPTFLAGLLMNWRFTAS